LKIAYVIAGTFDKESGVVKKIYNQIKEWEKHGNQVKLFCFTKREVTNLLKSLDIEIINFRNNFSFVLNPFLTKKVLRWRPDIVYFRQDFFTLSFYFLFNKLPTVIEYNSDDIEEAKLIYSFPVRIFHLITRELINKSAVGFVTVTYELEKKLEKYNKPIITIANGIDRNTVKIQRKNHTSKIINVLFLGSPNQPWHGVDKIYYLASKLPDVDFHLVGITDEVALDNVHTYGYLNLEQYVKIVEVCDVGIGTLALHRKKMNEASPLKVREYLHFGLPVIIGYEDTDFIGKEEDFILKIPNNEDNIENNIHLVSDFIKNSKYITVDRKKIAHIYFEEKEKKRLGFLASFIDKGVAKLE
jgi:Glycosyltransferase Family 4